MSSALLWALWGLLAFAQDEPVVVAEPDASTRDEPVLVADPDAPNDEGTVDEIVVWGQLAIRVARTDLVRSIRDQGYTILKRREGVIVFKAPKTWMGRALLYEDGTLSFLRPVLIPKDVSVADHGEYGDFGATERNTQFIGLVSEEDLRNDPSLGAQDLGTPIYTIVPRLGLYFMPRKSLLEMVQFDLLSAIEPKLDHYRATVTETAHQEAVEGLAERLDATWIAGVSLDDGPPLEGAQARKQAVLDFWATRAASREGDHFSRAVELWLEETVQGGMDAVTADEAAAAEARRVDRRKLALTFSVQTDDQPR